MLIMADVIFVGMQALTGRCWKHRKRKNGNDRGRETVDENVRCVKLSGLSSAFWTGRCV